jgi:ribose/xylose/arabinose/galactoside ABC-type transport system permease subunit
MMQKINQFITNNQKFLPLSATIILFFVVYLAGSIFYPAMRDPQVFFNLFRTSPFLLISAVGMTFVILTGGIDLSVSGLIALTTVATAALLRTGDWNPWAVMGLMLLMGMAFGAMMGAFITYMKVQPFIATLAGMWFARGLCFFISDDAISIRDPVFRLLGQTKILIPGLADPVTKQGDYISILVVVELVVLLVAIYICQFTRFGRTIYAIGGNEQSARLMGLPADTTKMLVYTLNGFCSALAGLTLAIYVMSGHGLYVNGFELDVIASVVIGGTMLSGGAGYVFGTLFGVLITGLIQTLIMFNGKLSSWWIRIVIGLLTLGFIGVQSLLAARQSRILAHKKEIGQKKPSGIPEPALAAGGDWLAKHPRARIFFLSAGGLAIVLLAVLMIVGQHPSQKAQVAGAATSTVATCKLQPFRQDKAAELIEGGAIIAYERNGGATCLDELYAVYSDGRIVGDDGSNKIEKQVTAVEVEQLLAAINDKGWFTENMYSTSHTPCGQCYSYYLTVTYNDQIKTVQAVDGGTDAPASYWQVISILNGVIPKFSSTQ